MTTEGNGTSAGTVEGKGSWYVVVSGYRRVWRRRSPGDVRQRDGEGEGYRDPRGVGGGRRRGSVVEPGLRKR